MDAATGCISSARELLATSLANCTAFRSWSGPTWSVAEARTHVHQQALPEEGEDWLQLESLRPFAVIARPNNANRFAHLASPRCFSSSGMLVVELHWSPPPLDKDDVGRNVRAFENFLGSLIRTGDSNAPGLLDLSGTYGYLNIVEVVVDGPYRVSPQEVAVVGDCYLAYLEIEWGVRG
jgi:hypothetical protein